MPRQTIAARKAAASRPRRPADEPSKRSGPTGVRTAPNGRRFHAPEHAIREYALGLPQAWEDFPWGHRAFRVNKKVAPKKLGARLDEQARADSVRESRKARMSRHPRPRRRPGGREAQARCRS